MIDKAKVRVVLNTIIDPCSVVAGVAAGIDEMGLIRRSEVFQGPGGTTIHVVIGVTEPCCLMGVPFANEARKRLLALPNVAHVEVTLDRTQDWTPKDMSPEYQAKLTAYRSRQRRALDIHPLRRKEVSQ